MPTVSRGRFWQGRDRQRRHLKVGDVEGAVSAASGEVRTINATAAQPSMTMAQTVPADKAWTVFVTVNSVQLNADVDYTTNGTTTLSFTTPLNAGDIVSARHVYPY